MTKNAYVFKCRNDKTRESNIKRFVDQAKIIGYDPNVHYQLITLPSNILVEIFQENAGILSTLANDCEMEFDIEATMRRTPKRLVSKKGSVKIILV